MTAPLRTAGQFLAENGFGQYGADKLNFPEYPAEDAQLQALRKLEPQAREISWIEYALARAREARLADEHRQEQAELATARRHIEASFRRHAPKGEWGMVAAILALIAFVGVLVWVEQRRKAGRRRRQNVPYREDTYLPPPGDDEDDGDEDDDTGEDEGAAEDEDDA